jgi:polyhydroxyalkanoate synthesis regulator phasin
MDEPASDGSLRDSVERLALAAVGAVALTGERADALAEALAARGALRREEARAVIEDMRTRWRGDALRLSERAGGTLAGLVRELGLVTRADYEELELRVAQLEHRMRLVEGAAPEPSRRR